jgi:hypothetical protein
MKTATRCRARRAIRILKLLPDAKIHPDGGSLSDVRFFNRRCLDDCFEAGDGTEVVVLIMQAYRTDEALRRAFRSRLASCFVDLDGWSKTLADWEARQPAPPPSCIKPHLIP